MFEIDIPKYNQNTPITRIGMWCSGGADSSLLLYVTLHKIIKDNLPIAIQPFTVRRPRPWNPPHAMDAIFKIRELLNLNGPGILDDHIIYVPPGRATVEPDGIITPYADNEKIGYDYANKRIFRKYNEINFNTNNIQLLMSGITKSPPKRIQETFRDGVFDLEDKRGEDVERIIHAKNYEYYNYYEYKPFFNFDKKELAQIYKEYDLLDTLFPVTRSCEGWQNITGHCGKCWWCEERMWGFGKL